MKEMGEHETDAFDVLYARPVPNVLHRLAPEVCKKRKAPPYMGVLSSQTSIFSALARSRTRNLLIRSQALYPLSY